MIVIDASIALGWSHRDEVTDAIKAVFSRVSDTGAIVPAIWPTEIANGLEMALRRGRIDIPLRNDIIQTFAQLGIDVEACDVRRVWGAVLELAARHKLTVYDASYLELAMRRGLHLATLDGQLITAAHAEGVAVLP